MAEESKSPFGRPLFIKIGNPALDGEYEFPWPLNLREEHYVKRISDGVQPTSILLAASQGDAGVWVALCSIALARNEKPHDIQSLWDAPSDGVGIVPLEDGTVEEPDAVPPASAAPGGENENTDIRKPAS